MNKLTGEKLKYIRILRGYTQQQVADAIGCSRRLVSYMEKMEREITDERYVKWIKFLNKTNTKKQIDEIKNDVEQM